MIKKIIKCLKENALVSDWLIREIKQNNSEAYYVMQALETTRLVETTEYHVTVYQSFTENDKDYLGSSTFIISHKMSTSQIQELINEGIQASKYIRNPAYKLVSGDKKRKVSQKVNYEDAFTAMDKIANSFFAFAKPNVRFNSFEIFCKKTITHIVNSQGVDLTKVLNQIDVEAIPSYNGEDLKVELYKDYHYTQLDLEQAKVDAQTAISEVESRYFAKKIENVNKIDVIIKNLEVQEFFYEIIYKYSYVGVYKKSSDKVIGDNIQNNPKGELLTIGMKSNKKENFFDQDGVILKPITVISEGKLINYYGNNQYASYLNIEPTGELNMLVANKGKTPISKMKNKPHIEIYSLSGIQLDIDMGYVGGEVRLAKYFDGNKYYDVSGFSFSGNINDCLNDMELSKETVTLMRYTGPQYLKLKNMDIM